MKFDDFPFTEEVKNGIQKAGFSDCMPVQEEVFRHALLEGRDVTVQSRTGTGKTAAFLLTILQKFSQNGEKRHKALIVAPTRELAVQIETEAELLASGLELNIASFYGGVGYKSQVRDIEEGVDVIIGTPGRLIDFSGSKKHFLQNVDILVIDEADRLFDMGFLPDLKKIMRKLAGPKERQTMLFSATLGMKVQQLAWEFLYEPKEIVIDNDRVTVDEITQVLYHVASNEKLQLLLGILERDKPESTLIFTNTKHAAVKLAKRLRINGYHAEYIMGDLPQKKRLSIIEKIKNGEIDLLVATDVAARGLHINDLDMVVNYDIPEDPENYVHRIGRTARAGKSGKSVTLACERLVYGLEAIESFIGMKIPSEVPDPKLLETEDKSRFTKVSGDFRRTEKQSKGRDRKGRSDKRKRTDRTEGNERNERKAPKKKTDMEKRLEYYKQKYGEDFKVVDR
jgi:ATP-dependent RNA helicase RhlB